MRESRIHVLLCKLNAMNVIPLNPEAIQAVFSTSNTEIIAETARLLLFR